MKKVMRNSKFILVLLSLLIFCITPFSVVAGSDRDLFTDADFAMLPPFCRIWYVEKGHTIVGRNELAKQYGTPYSLHHLCPGLKYLNDAFKQVSKVKREELSIKAAGELGAVLRNDGSFPLRHVVFRKRGQAYSLQGLHNKAIADYEGAIKLKPNYKDVYGDLFDVYIQLGKKEEAIKWLDKGLKFKPDYKPLLARKKKIQN